MDAEQFKPPPRGEDLPYDDGEPMESDRHVEQMILLRESLKDREAARADEALRRLAELERLHGKA